MDTSRRNQDVKNFDIGKSLEEKTILYATDYSFHRTEDVSISVPLNESKNQGERSQDENTELDYTVPYALAESYQEQDDHNMTSGNGIINDHDKSKYKVSGKGSAHTDSSLVVPKTEKEDNVPTLDYANQNYGRSEYDTPEKEPTMISLPKEVEKEFGTAPVKSDSEEKLKPPQPISEIRLTRCQPSQPARKEKRKYFRKHYSTEQLQEALQKCREGVSIRECSKQFGIPKSTLWDKLSSRTPAAVMRPGRSIKVSSEVENK